MILKTNIKVTPKDILEMNYYSLETDKRDEFLEEVKNQIVDVSMNNGIILISYNVNEVSNGNLQLLSTTTTYTSKRAATIKMQDSVTGTWGQVDATLTGYFKKTTNTSSWTIYPYDSNITVDTTSPCGSSIGYVAGSSQVTSSSTYYGNEVYYKTDIQAFCGFNDSDLYIIVYPNSSYNTAYIE